MPPNPKPLSEPHVNPTPRLEQPPNNGCLHEKDGRLFSALLACGRMAANSISGLYPNLQDDGDKMVRAYADQAGMLVLSHLTATMYSYWDSAPSGRSCYDVAMHHATPELQTLLRDEAFFWGNSRIVAPPHAHVVVVDDTDKGTIVADESLTKFYRVLGLMCTPGQALKRAGQTMPVRARLTALPFRGVLVYDGLLGGSQQTPPLTASEKQKVLRGYKEAVKKNEVITGLNLPAPPPLVVTPEKSALRDMDEFALRAFVGQRNGERGLPLEKLLAEAERVHDRRANEKGVSAAAPRGPSGEGVDPALQTPEAKRLVETVRKLEKCDAFFVARRFGYSTKENPNNLVGVMWDTAMIAMFHTEELDPTPMEVLLEFANICQGKKRAPRMVAVDHAEVARKLNDVLHGTGVQIALYPQPSPEEQTLLAVVPPPVFEALSKYGMGL